jgi:hypothetical protein
MSAAFFSGAWDLDTLFGYKTVRHVNIRDRRLGLLYVGLSTIAFAYVLGYNLIYNQLYRKTGDVIGTATLSLGPGYRVVPPANTSYCGTGPGAVFPAPGGIPFPRQQCRFLDSMDNVFPTGEDSAIFVATAITETNQTLPQGCAGQPDPSCAYSNTGNISYFVGEVEWQLLRLTSVITVPALGLSASNIQMKGTLQDEAGQVFNPCDDYPEGGCPPSVEFGEPNVGIVLPLQTLLRVAGIPSLDVAGPNADVTFRSAGLILLISVDYSNFYSETGSYEENYLSYRAIVSTVASAGYSAIEVVSGADGSVSGTGTGIGLTRLLVNRHGLRIIVRQSGSVGRFDAAQLLLTLTTSLSLIAVAKVVVDYLATRVLPKRYIYRQYIEVRTVDFSDLEEMDPDILERFKTDDLINPAPSVFGSVDLHGHITRRPHGAGGKGSNRNSGAWDPEAGVGAAAFQQRSSLNSEHSASLLRNQ